jgi:hypothetical protein
MVTSWESVRGDERMIVPPESPSSKVIVSAPEPAAQSGYAWISPLAFVIASRREQPLPLVVSSAVVVTVSVAAYAGLTPNALKMSAREVRMNKKEFLREGFIKLLLLMKMVFDSEMD